MTLPAPKSGVVTLEAGKLYAVPKTVKHTGKVRYVVAGKGRPTLDGTLLQKNAAIFRVEKGCDLTLPALNYIVGKDRIALQCIGGSLEANGDMGGVKGLDRYSHISGGGLLLLAQQAERLTVRNYIYDGAPEKYVVFCGDPMQRFDPKWNMDGRCRKSLVENIIANGHRKGARNQSEARFRFMLFEGRFAGLEGDTTANYEGTAHKQAFQPRGAGGIGECCKFAGSVSLGPLNAKKETVSYQKVAPSIPHAYWSLKDFTGTGYVMAERKVTALLVGWNITGIDPRAKGKVECFSATGGAELVLVGCSVSGFAKFSAGNCVIGAGCALNGKAVPVTAGWEKKAKAAAEKAQELAKG